MLNPAEKHELEPASPIDRIASLARVDVNRTNFHQAARDAASANAVAAAAHAAAHAAPAPAAAAAAVAAPAARCS